MTTRAQEVMTETSFKLRFAGGGGVVVGCLTPRDCVLQVDAR